MKKGVLITAAAKRLGRSMAVFLAKKGYDIVVHYNTSAEDAFTLQNIIESYGQKCFLIQADFNDFSSLLTLVKYTYEVMPYCIGLVNNASVFYRKSFFQTTEQDFVENYNIHVKVPFFLIKYFTENFKNGYIVNIIDADVSKETSPNYFAYMASKKSLMELTKMLSLELKFMINGICPSKISDYAFNDNEVIDKKLINILNILLKLLNCNETGKLYFI